MKLKSQVFYRWLPKPVQVKSIIIFKMQIRGLPRLTEVPKDDEEGKTVQEDEEWPYNNAE